ncbi:MAG: nucleoside hydrolase [Lentisphaeria bacterium]|nr:nucleoside hydrolase [Lentisphaeria bacterium]
MSKNFVDESFEIVANSYPVPVILDTDTFNEIDDQFAVVYAIMSPDKIDLKGITAELFFNSRAASYADGMEKSYQEICKILDVLKLRDKIPALKGSTNILKNKSEYVQSEAVDFIISEAKKAAARDEKLFVVAIGAVTNVASALIKAPEIAENIVIIWLGGHEIDYDKTPREFNLQGDIIAAQVMVESKAKFIRIPCWNVAGKLTIAAEELHENLKGGDAAGEYLKETFASWWHNQINKIIWDISAIACITIPEAMKTRIISKPTLDDECYWHYTDDSEKIMEIIDIDRDMVFSDMFDRVKKHNQ